MCYGVHLAMELEDKQRQQMLNQLHTQPDGSTTIVCLCGSASQKADFESAECREELAGKIVFSLNIFSSSDGVKLSDSQIQLITRLHYQKMDLAHEILIVLKPDPTGTKSLEQRLGIHTKQERDYAVKHRKLVNYYDPHNWAAKGV